MVYKIWAKKYYRKKQFLTTLLSFMVHMVTHDDDDDNDQDKKKTENMAINIINYLVNWITMKTSFWMLQEKLIDSRNISLEKYTRAETEGRTATLRIFPTKVKQFTSLLLLFFQCQKNKKKKYISRW